MRRNWTVALVLVAMSGAVGAGEPDNKARPGGDLASVQRLITQLGSRRFSERESAMAALIGRRAPGSIDLLRKAAQSQDIEIRRRARQVLEHLRRQDERERILRPQRIKLSFKDTPVIEAVAEFARVSGLPVVLADADRAKVQTRKISLQADLTLWEGLQQFCDAAGLAERIPEITRPVTGGMEQQEFVGRRQNIIWLDGRRNLPTRDTRQIVLGDGKGKRPTFIAGALRIQALTGLAAKDGPASVGREVGITLEANIDSRLGWNRIVSLRVDRAVDSQGQKLVQPSIFVGEDNPWHQYGSNEIIVVWDGRSQMPMSRSRQATVRLRLGAKPARQIKELHGTLAVEVEAAAEPLVTVPAILEARGKTISGPESSYVKVLEVKREPSGLYGLKVEVKGPPTSNDWPTLPNVRILRINRGMQGGMEPASTLNALELAKRGLSLLDAKGQPIALASGDVREGEDPRSPRVYSLYFEPRKDQGPPSRLVFSGRCNALLEVPFVLRDVPLP